MGAAGYRASFWPEEFLAPGTDSLRFLGVQGRDQRWDGILPASVAAICSMSMTDSSSLLNDISAAVAGDAFLAPIRDRVQQFLFGWPPHPQGVR